MCISTSFVDLVVNALRFDGTAGEVLLVESRRVFSIQEVGRGASGKKRPRTLRRSVLWWSELFRLALSLHIRGLFRARFWQIQLVSQPGGEGKMAEK